MKPACIYIVEDEFLIAEEIVERLTALGYQVCGRAARGEQALQEIPPLQPNLVLMNIKLAGELSGIETADRLRSLVDLPVVLLGAFVDDRTIGKAIDSTAFGYLVKPFEERVLHATIQAALYRHEVEQLRRVDKDRLEATVQERSAQLWESEAMLRDIFDSTTDLIVSVALDGVVRFANRAWRETLGYSEAETATITLDEVIHPVDRERWSALHQRLLRGENTGLFEVACAAKDGRSLTLEGRMSVRFAAGQPVAMRGTFRDVTEVRRTERADRMRLEQAALFQGTLLGLRDQGGNELPVFFKLVTSALAQALRVERASVWLFDAGRTALECQDLFLRSSLIHERGLRLVAADYPRYFNTLNFLESIEADDAHTHPATSEFSAGYLTPLGISSMIDVPIRAGSHLAGVLRCEHTGPAHQWTAEENKFAIAVASYTMLALEQAERRQVEAALKKMRFSVEHASDSIFWVGRDGRILYANEAACTSRGYTREEMLALHIFDFDPDSQPGDWGPHFADLKRRGAMTLEMRHRSKNGRIYPIEVSANYVNFDGEEFNFCSVRDITRRRQGEAALRESEARHRLLIHSCRDAIMTLQPPTWKFTSCNPAAVELFGVQDEAAFCSLGPWDFSPEVQPDGRRSAEKAAVMIARAMRDGSHFFDWTHRRADGRSFPTTVLLSRIDHDGQEFLQATVRDITAQRAAEAAVREHAQLLTQMFLAAPVATVLSDLATGEIIDVNHQFVELAGRPREALVGQSSLTLGLWQNPAVRAKIQAAVSHAGAVSREETTMIMPDGATKHIGFSVALVEVGGRRCALSTLADITRRKEAERALRDREALLSSINANLTGTCVYRMIYDPAGAMTCDYVSPNVGALLGVTAEAFQAEPAQVFRLIHEEDRTMFQAEFATMLRTGAATGVALRVRRSAGGVRWMEFRSQLVERLADGTQVRDGVVVDITAAKEAEVESRNLHERLALALHASRTCTWDDDVAANRIILDSAWAELLGLPTGETVTTTHRLIAGAHPDDRSTILAASRRAITGETDDYLVEHRVATAAGNWLWIKSSGRVVARDAKGKATRIIGTNTDVTIRKHAELALRKLNSRLETLVLERTAALAASTAKLAESEAHYRGLVESISQGYYVADRRSVLTYCNPAVAGVLGVPERELLGTSVFRIIAEDDRERVIAAYREWSRDGASQGTIEFRIGVRRGGFIDVEQSTTIVRDAAGAVQEFRNIVRDVTDRKAAEARLRQSEERFRAVFDRSPVMIALLALPEGRVVEANTAALAGFGFQREEVIGRSSTELGFWADPAARDRYLSLLQAAGHVSSFETRMRRKNGEEFHALYSGSLVMIGNQSYSLNSIQDITEWRRAEAALRESEVLFRSVFDASPIPILVSAIPTGEIVEINAAGLDSFGFPREEIVGRSTEELGVWVQPGQRAEFFRRVATGQPFQNFEAALRTKAGVERIMLCAGTHLTIAGRSCVLSSGIDITAVRQAETDRAAVQSKLFQSQKFEALGTLAGGVAHDFNNILTVILNYTQLAQEDCPPTHPQIRDFLGEVLKCGNRAKELVRQILLFSRTETVVRGPLMLQHVVKEAGAFLRASIPAAVKIDLHIDPQAPLVLANATQLHQVLMNLGVNAAHAMHEQGGQLNLALRARMVDPALAEELPGLKPGAHAHLEVSDNGCGMEPAVVARIFEPFFTTKKIGEGTGLGLAVAHSVVQDHEGAIRVRSQPGVGTTFEIFLPAHAKGAVVGDTESRDLPRGRGQRILLVDDEVAVAESGQIMLERLGYRVTRFTNPEQALARFWAAPDEVDVLVADFQMPGMTGIALSQRILTRRPALPVFIASGFSGGMTPEMLRGEGIAGVFHKPIDWSELAGALAHKLGG